MLFTTTKLYAGGQQAVYEADQIIIDGTNWEVQQVQSWEQPGPMYFRCIVQSAVT